MDTFHFEKPIYYKIPSLQKKVIKTKKLEFEKFSSYYETFNNMKWKDIPKNVIIAILCYCTLLLLIGLLFLYIFIDTFETQINIFSEELTIISTEYQNATSYELKIYSKIELGLLLIIFYIIESFLVFVAFNSFYSIFRTLRKPFWFSKEQKDLFNTFSQKNYPSDLNPIIIQQRDFLGRKDTYFVQFNNIHPDIDNETFILALNKGFSLIGLSIALGFDVMAIFWYFIENEPGFSDLVIFLGFVLFAFGAIVFTYRDIISPLRTFWRYYHLKKKKTNYIDTEIKGVYNKILQNLSSNEDLNLLNILIDQRNRLKQTPKLPISKQIRIYSVIGLLLPILGLLI